MTLGSIVKEYRLLHGISQREFAKMSGLSNGYISQLEANRNTKNGLPIQPSLETVKQVAEAMNTDFDTVLRQMGDFPVSLSLEPERTETDELTERIMQIVSAMPENLKQSLLDLLLVKFGDGER